MAIRNDLRLHAGAFGESALPRRDCLAKAAGTCDATYKGAKLALGLVACIFLLVGCGQKGGPGPSNAGTAAFDNASQELKQTWNLALEASRTNDYVKAQTLLFGMLRQQPTPEQTTAIQNEIALSRQHLEAAVQQGDPAAQAALRQLRQNPPNRPH